MIFFLVTSTTENVCDQSLWNLGQVTKYKNGGLGKTYQSLFHVFTKLT